MNNEAGPTPRRWVKPVVSLLVVGTMFAAWMVLPVKALLQHMLEGLAGLGGVGLVILAVIYVVACVLLVPGLVLTLGAGFLSAAVWPNQPLLAILFATIAVSLGSVAGAGAAFLLGRTLAREWVDNKVRANEKFRAIDEAVGRMGFKMVFLVRLSPVFPFNLLNYALGLTKVTFRSYFFASWIGMLPMTIVYVYIGSVAQSITALAADKAETTLAQKVLWWGGLIVTIVVVGLVTRVARQALKQAMSEQPTKNVTPS